MAWEVWLLDTLCALPNTYTSAVALFCFWKVIKKIWISRLMRHQDACHFKIQRTRKKSRSVWENIFSAYWMHTVSELVPVSKQDIVACIPSFHCSANLISVTMEVELGVIHTYGHCYGMALGLNNKSTIICVLVFQLNLINVLWLCYI